jgi:hypothetical protein
VRHPESLAEGHKRFAPQKNQPCNDDDMKQNLMLAAVAAGLLFSQSRAPGAEAQTGQKVRTPVDWVNPLVDTHNSRWFYFNSACRPFGMVNLSPDTRTKGSWQSGYLYADNHIRCFSHIHAWELSGIPVLPITGPMIGHQGMDAYQSEFSHDDEVVRPGYHKVALKTYGVTAELTSTLRVGFHRYTFPVGRESYVLFDVGAYLAQGPMVRAEVRRASDTEIEGMSLMGATLRRKKETPVFFVAQFSEPMTDFGGWQKGELLPKVKSVAGPEVGAFVRFAPKQPLLMKVAISYTSVEHARKNLEAELDHWDFDRIVAESAAEWNTHLSRIQVEGGTDAERTKFYTDLWRAMLGRRVLSDVAGSYMDMTGDEPRVRHVPLNAEGKPEFNMHNFDAWWGSHWSLDILWPLLCPERYRDFCLTSLEMFKNGGLIPRGPSGGNYTFVMIGDSAAPALTAAYQKGIRDFDAKLILRGLVRNTEADGGRYYGGYASHPSPKVHAEYEHKGYVSWSNFLGGCTTRLFPRSPYTTPTTTGASPNSHAASTSRRLTKSSSKARPITAMSSGRKSNAPGCGCRTVHGKMASSPWTTCLSRMASARFPPPSRRSMFPTIRMASRNTSAARRRWRPNLTATFSRLSRWVSSVASTTASTPPPTSATQTRMARAWRTSSTASAIPGWRRSGCARFTPRTSAAAIRSTVTTATRTRDRWPA